MAVAMSDGTRILEMASGRELFYLPTGHVFSVLFEPTGDLLTCGFQGPGLQRWPIRVIRIEEGALENWSAGKPAHWTGRAGCAKQRRSDARGILRAQWGSSSEIGSAWLGQPVNSL